MKEKLNYLLSINFISVYLLVFFYIITSLNDALWMTDWKEIMWVCVIFAAIVFPISKISEKVNIHVSGQEILAFISFFALLLLPKLYSNLFSLTNGNVKLSYLLILCTIIMGLAIYRIVRSPNYNFLHIKKFLVILISLFIIVEIIFAAGVIQDKSNLEKSILKYKDSLKMESIKLHAKPNIYHIIFDAYTGFDALHKYWNFRDTTFLQKINEGHIKIAFEAKTCKDNTLESITSIFNMKSLETKLKFRSLATKSKIYRKLIKNANVIRQFELNGYHINNLSIFDIGSTYRYWDFPWLKTNMNFQQFCFFQSLLGNIYKNYLNREISNKNIEIIRNIYKIIQHPDKTPAFTYVHLIMPHMPNNFDKNGNFIGSIVDNKDAYLEEMQYCNKIMIEMIELMKQNDPTAILIFQSDHGSGMLPDYYNFEVENILSILDAPYEYQIEWPENMLNINTYKYLFNALGDKSTQINPCQD